MNEKSIRLFIAFVAVFLIAVFYVLKVENRPKDNWIKTIESDGIGYHLYLMAAIHGDFEYEFTKSLDSVYKEEISQQVSWIENGRTYTKYFSGVAILSSPFFIGAAVVANLFDYPSDGLSLPFQYGQFIASLFYFLLGIYLVNQTLVRCKFSKFSIYLSLFGLVFATNTINYVWKEPAFSHAFAFFLVSLLCWVFSRLENSYSKTTLGTIGLIVGMIFITRPTTILAVLALPLFFSGWFEFRKFIFSVLSDYTALVYIFSGLLIPVGIQSGLYLLQTDEFWIYSYGEEGFNFLSPEILNFLFSFQKGWFLYTPFFLLMVLGFVKLFKRDRYKFYVGVLFLSVTIWVLSSWWCWFYGGSFGMRSMIDFYPICIIPIAIGLNEIYSKAKQLILIGVVSICGLLNIIQNYQYYNEIIHYSEMDKDKYLQVFLRVSDEAKFITFPLPNYLKNREIVSTEKVILSLENGNCDNNLLAFGSDGKVIQKLNLSYPYSCVLKVPIDKERAVRNEVIVGVKSSLKIDAKIADAHCVLASEAEGGFWKGQNLSKKVRKANSWTEADYTFRLKEDELESDTVLAYYFINSKTELNVADMEATVYYCKLNEQDE